MTEKRFENVGKDIFQYGEWWCSANGEHCADVIATAINELIEENEQLKEDYDYLEKRFKEEEWHYEHIDEDRDVWMHKCQELEKENEQLKEEIKGLNDILARYEEKELENIAKKDKSCGHCKHLQIDGMFGMWCDKKRNWTEVKYCEDYERDVHDSYLF